MTLLNKERLIKYLNDLHARELNAYCGVNPAGGPAFSPNVLVEILRKVGAGDFDQGAEMVGEKQGLVRSFIEGVMYIPRHIIRGMTWQDLAKSMGVAVSIFLMAFVVAMFVKGMVLFIWLVR